MIKRISALVAALLIAVFLPSCTAKKYSDTVECSKLANAAIGEIPLDNGYAAFDQSHLKYNFANTDLCDDHAFFYSIETNDINEIGILRAKDSENVEELAGLARSYIAEIKENNRAFIQSYAPNEVNKLDNAKVYILGKYVIYTVLSPNDTELVIKKIESLL